MSFKFQREKKGGNESNEESKENLILMDGILVEVDDNAVLKDSSRADSFLANFSSLSSVLDDVSKIQAEYEVFPSESESMEVSSTVQRNPGKDATCTLSLYNSKGVVSEETLSELIGPEEDGGLIYSIEILHPDSKEAKIIKARRRMPFPITLSDFDSAVTRVGQPIFERLSEDGYDELWDRTNRDIARESSILHDTSSARWIFSGVLNGWPGLTTLEVLKVDYTNSRSNLFHENSNWKDLWCVYKEGEYGKEPSELISEHWKKPKSSSSKIRALLRGPKWTSVGWSRDSPGFVFWVEGGQYLEDHNKTPQLTVTYGRDLLKRYMEKPEGESKCEKIHMISHRYAKGKGKKETAKDRLLYHTLVLMEWDHGEYCTVAEIGYLNGVAGYRGRANWYHDKDDEAFSQLYKALPPEMVLPWKTTMSEIRLHDVPYKTVDDFINNFMKPYEGPSARFLDIQKTFSHTVRLTYNSRLDISTYLVNYILRDHTYSEMKRNCQTFAADLCGFLAGKRDVKPFHPLMKIEYVNRNHFFLYQSDQYKSKKKKGKKSR